MCCATRHGFAGVRAADPPPVSRHYLILSSAPAHLEDAGGGEVGEGDGLAGVLLFGEAPQELLDGAGLGGAGAAHQLQAVRQGRRQTWLARLPQGTVGGTF